MAELVKKSGVREAAKGVNVGADYYEALDEVVNELIKDSVTRAEANGRRTIKARDV